MLEPFLLHPDHLQPVLDLFGWHWRVTDGWVHIAVLVENIVITAIVLTFVHLGRPRTHAA